MEKKGNLTHSTLHLEWNRGDHVAYTFVNISDRVELS